MDRPLHPGDPRRLGGYELLGRLGEGGMGTVFLARDQHTDRPVAIKVVRAEFGVDDEFLRRFRSEVNRARQVPPFCTAEVLDADPDHDPPYLVVEYVEGPTLTAVVRDRGPLRGAALHGLAVGIATALTAIHGAGVIHRDLKPANVLMALGGVKVIDFGIARPLMVTSHHTRGDQMLGTVAYMAPERFEPEHAGRVGFGADIFAWGAVVMYAATGRTPFAADSAPATAMRILTQPPDLDGLDGQLRDIVARCLAKDPAARPSARELLDLLIAIADTPGAAVPRQVPGVAEPMVATPPPGDRTPDAYQPPAPSALGAAGTVGAAGAAGTANAAGAAGATPRPARRGRTWLAAAAAVVAAGAGAGFALREAGGVALQETGGARGSSAEPPAAAPSRAAPSAGPAGLPGILAGRRRTLLHLATIDRDLELPQNAPARPGSGTKPESYFVLTPRGENFQIKSAVRDLADKERCIGVKLSPTGPGSLAPTTCDVSDLTVFRISPTGSTDEKNRPTYSLTSGEYGVVQWSDANRRVYIELPGDFPATLEVSFVDRGAL